MKLDIHIGKVKAIAKKEFMDNVRNKWVLSLTIIFIILTLVMSYFTIAATPSSVSEIAIKGEWDPINNYAELGDNGLGGKSYDAYIVNNTGNFTFDGQAYEFVPLDWVVQIDSHWQKFKFMGIWDAASNVPELTDNGGNGTQGDIYYVQVAGNTLLDGNNTWSENDVLINWDGKWNKLVAPESNVGFKGYSDTVAGMSTIAAMLLPIIAIMLGYSSIIGERENGSMGVVLGCPVSRNDVVIGKFGGLGLVMFTTIFLGFGISGLIVGALAGFADSLEYLLFMVLTFLFAMFFLGFSIFMSTIASKRSTAIAGGLAIFFSGMIAGVILFGIWAATGGDINALTEQAMKGVMPQFPDWLWAGYYFCFMDIYPMGAAELFGITEFFGFKLEYPWFINAPYIFAWFIFLSGSTFLASILSFRKKDI
ncbi:MAG: ABC transporter permease subunit [Candidatus Thermoplasmatota archaeon]|nr:ABC transporter permease subunit [Candidatus Thermoplasmatota archaeon]MBU4071258.1 ABC transporter permease subunit [Candidatus Thermoplasmatota archaeon]MBU4144891.1 ABC transporter permease subunit [Candidatus Thermoplasmatota archaeon]MBU4592858.1 ABC transporter permease subunit [Candidatus Thermoplasmatota archaeon]